MLLYLSMIERPADRDKFLQVYELYKDLLYRIAMDILKNRDDAEDAVQQTFLRVIRRLDGIDRADSARTRSFVVLLCRYCSIDLYNERKRASVVPPDMPALAESTQDDFVLDAFRRLPYPYRDLLLLRYRHGYSAREIAGMLGMKYETVKKYIQRAKERLAALLKEEAEVHEG